MMSSPQPVEPALCVFALHGGSRLARRSVAEPAVRATSTGRATAPPPGRSHCNGGKKLNASAGLSDKSLALDGSGATTLGRPRGPYLSAALLPSTPQCEARAP
jgi:hypothetical protein